MDDQSLERAELLKYFRDETSELLDRIDADLLRLETLLGEPVVDAELIASLFRALHTIKGNAGMLEFYDVARVSHALENVVDLLRNGRLDMTVESIELLFEGRDLLTTTIRSGIEGAESPMGLRKYLQRLDNLLLANEHASAEEEAQVGPVDLDAAQAVVDAFLTGVPVTVPAPPSPEPEPQSRPASQRPVTSTRTETVRVDVERLDLLMNLVGELVINRTRIADIAATFARALANRPSEGSSLDALAKDLAESAALLGRTTNEIQESIMKVRMIPIGTVFERFPRLIRDLARSRGKEVELIIEGAETDLDKTIVDHIGEPLLHLVRNCIDHGIEDPRTREVRGKSRVGKIRLGAFHEGNQIIIEVEDDGAGIDLPRVRERAVRLGLLAENDARTERELMQLIFFPGFTTAEHVDDVSGRGVGMDVVKRTVLGLKGSFETDSTRGVRTKFTIKLPLTLAIIEALLVRIGAELYAIPLDAVIESQRIDPDELRVLHGGEVITVRGVVIPLIRLAEFLGVSSNRHPSDKVMIVIVGVGGRQIGLVVDGFQGEQEIVIKPLADVVGRIPGISGATILGNGSISLILDVHTLVAAAHDGERSARAEFSAV